MVYIWMFQFQMVHEFLLSLSEDIFEILRFLEDNVFYPSFEYLVCFWVVKLCFDEIAEKEDVNYLVFIVGTFLIGYRHSGHLETLRTNPPSSLACRELSFRIHSIGEIQLHSREYFRKGSSNRLLWASFRKLVWCSCIFLCILVQKSAL